MAIGHLKQRLDEAMRALVSPEPIQARLTHVGKRLPSGLNLDSLPKDIRLQVDDIIEKLSGKEPPASGSSVETTCSQLSDEDAEKLALRVVELFVEVMGGLA